MPDKTLYPFTPQKISIQGHKLAFLDQGKGKVVVMLHGNPTWSFYYRNLVSRLQDRYRLIVPDHMGCGFSDKPQNYPYTLKTHIDNLEYLLESLAIKSFSLVVHDWGGAIGMGLAVRHPARLESAVVLNTAAFLSNRIPFRIRLCRVPVLGDLIVRGLNGFARAALSMAVTRPLEPQVASGYLEPYDSWANRIAIMRFVQDIPLSHKDDSWETLKEIDNGLQLLKNNPMMLLWGGRDFCFTRHFYEQWLERFPEAEHHFFPEAGHYVLEDAFDDAADLIDTFFKNHLGQ